MRRFLVAAALLLLGACNTITPLPRKSGPTIDICSTTVCFPMCPRKDDPHD